MQVGFAELQAALHAAESNTPVLVRLSSTSAFKKLFSGATGIAKALLIDDQASASGLPALSEGRLAAASALTAELQDETKQTQELLSTNIEKAWSMSEQLQECAVRLPSAEGSAHHPLRLKVCLFLF